MIKKVNLDNRNGALDIIRIIAIILVVLNHSIQYTTGINDFAFCLIYSFGRIGVPLFFILSGFLFLHRKFDNESTKRFYLRNLLPLLLTWEIWIIIYNVFLINAGFKSFDIVSIIKQIFLLESIGISNEWYMPCIIILYALIPFIANAINSIKIRYTIIISLLVYVFSFCVMTFADIYPIWFIYFNFNFVFYLLLGYFAYELKNIHIKRYIYLLIFLLFFSLFVFTKYVVYKDFDFKRYGNAFIPIIGLSIFEYLINLFKVKPNFILYKIADSAFGVYLSHMVIILIINKYMSFSNPWAKFTSLFFISLTSSFILTLIFSFIPYIGSIIFRTRENPLTHIKSN